MEFFATPAELRAWFEANHDTAAELWVAYRKRATGRPSITWPESVDVALCFGWIDGVRKSIDETAYRIRFTPRRPKSRWSAVNIARVAELTAAGLMRPEGLAAFASRGRDADYSHEQSGTVELTEAQRARFDTDAWAFLQAQAPSYRKAVIWWVVSAKKPETQDRRLDQLIAECAAGRRMASFSRNTRGPGSA